jgi:hypothetical protein
VGWVRVTLSANRLYWLTLWTDRIRQFLPWLHRPAARCGAGWRGQHEHNWEILQGRLPSQRNRFGWPSIEEARGFLAGEGDGLRLIAPHLFPERRNVDGEGEGLMVHARAELAKIGEADSEFQQVGKFMRRVAARRDVGLVERAPEPIAGMRVVMACSGRPLARGGADEYEAEAILELVGEFFHDGAGFVRVGSGAGAL